jgi:hypothetical protein
VTSACLKFPNFSTVSDKISGDEKSLEVKKVPETCPGEREINIGFKDAFFGHPCEQHTFFITFKSLSCGQLKHLLLN